MRSRSQDMESDALCRRLHLADLLSSVFQRITKYPLLLSSLIKQTQHLANVDEELERLRTAEARALDLLARVNHEIRMWENKHFLDHVLRKCAPPRHARSLVLVLVLVLIVVLVLVQSTLLASHLHSARHLIDILSIEWLARFV